MHVHGSVGYVCVDAVMPRDGGNQIPRGRVCRSELPDVGAEMPTCVLYNGSACSQPLCNLSSPAAV